MDCLEKVLLKEVNKENLLETVNCFNCLYRYSGTEQGEKAVSYIEGKLDLYGVSYEHCEYDGFFSLPVSAELSVGERTYSLIADVYSKETDNLKGELIYDHWSEKKKLTQLDNQVRFQAFKGKMVLSWDGKGTFAAEARRAGALAVIQICPTKGDYIHHSNIGIVWGTPDPDQEVYMQFLPAAGIRRSDGEALIEELKRENVCGSLSIKMDTDIRKSSMTIADIPGRSDSYILVSAHYDSWYEGITDNATSNAATLECARVLFRHKDELKRSVKVAFWSGHSDGRYAGSSWYVDTHWEDLDKNCVAHINLDLIGGKNDELVSRGTSLMEKEGLPESIIEEFSGVRPVLTAGLTRAGDESFSGVGVPISMLSRFASKEDGEYAQWASSYAPWWHSVADTLDKVDEEFLLRDARINLKIVWEILQSEKLPVDMLRFAEYTEKKLKDFQAEYSEDFSLRGVLEKLEELKGAVVKLENAIEKYGIQDTDEIIKKISGGMVRLHYTYGSPYYHDPAYGGYSDLHIFKMMKGVTRENTTPETYLMYQTDFRRQCNRQRAEMAKLIEAVDAQIFRWKMAVDA